ncbi:MAG: DUF4242 domain-containing protein, partial [Caldilineaceae bacterium]
TPQEAAAIAQKSCEVLRDLGPEIVWIHSYVVQNKTYCIYIAPSEELIRAHAAQSGFPADVINEVKTVIDLVTAEAVPVA